MALIFKEQPLYIVSINVLIAARVIEFVGNDLSFSLALYFIFQFFFSSHTFFFPFSFAVARKTTCGRTAHSVRNHPNMIPNLNAFLGQH